MMAALGLPTAFQLEEPIPAMEGQCTSTSGDSTSGDIQAHARRKEQEQARLEMLSLNTVLRSLGCVKLTVERKDESMLCGMLEEVDANMNLSLSNVTVTPAYALGAPTLVDLMYVPGTSIRCVHLPNQISAEKVMQNQLRAADAAYTDVQFRTKKAPQRPENLAPLVGATVSEENADLYSDI
mmetsp:Transcript_29423/g.68780  ORF Transcript_29423/g.68780 Transcript_29423/m.68780 type:complete len:182 (-) Transcript_29423:23-568(-)